MSGFVSHELCRRVRAGSIRRRSGFALQVVARMREPAPLRFLCRVNERGDCVKQAQVGKRFRGRREAASDLPSPQVLSPNRCRDFGTVATR